VKGECIGFGGRVLGDGTPKYLNSPETPVFSKGRELYGLWEARNALREHGQEGFARFVRQAVPLSTFLVEASAEGCDLATAEGRSHMVSNAGPLWKLMPDGALKRQVLGDIADRSQLGQHELLEIWGVAQPQARPRPRKAKDSEAPYSRRAYGAGHRQALKPKAVALAEIVARVVLRNSATWASLTDADHHLLCELPAPHGDLFSWLDTRFHDHGAEPWAVLELGLEGQPFTELVRRLIALDNMQPEGRAVEVEEFGEQELRRAMIGIHLDAVREEIEQAARLPQSDPSRMERLYELSKRQQALQLLSRQNPP
jgi:DNA primase